MLYFNRIELFEGTFVTIGVFQLKALSFKQMSAIDVMIY